MQSMFENSAKTPNWALARRSTWLDRGDFAITGKQIGSSKFFFEFRMFKSDA